MESRELWGSENRTLWQGLLRQTSLLVNSCCGGTTGFKHDPARAGASVCEIKQKLLCIYIAPTRYSVLRWRHGHWLFPPWTPSRLIVKFFNGAEEGEGGGREIGRGCFILLLAATVLISVTVRASLGRKKAEDACWQVKWKKKKRIKQTNLLRWNDFFNNISSASCVRANCKPTLKYVVLLHSVVVYLTLPDSYT